MISGRHAGERLLLAGGNQKTTHRIQEDKLMKKQFIGIIALIIAAVLIGLPCASLAKEYPKRPIQIIFPWQAGIPHFVKVQMIADRMEKIIGGQILVNAMPGGGGVKALKHVLSKKSDGYMILDAWVANLVFATLSRENMGYSYEDFEMIGKHSIIPYTIVVRKDQPWKTLGEFEKYARENPGMKYNCTGEWSVAHGVLANFLKESGIKAQGVPYPGLIPGLKDFLGGSLDFTVGNLQTIAVYGDKIRTLCVLLDQRHPWYPDIPTAKELGFDKGFGDLSSGWSGFVVKKGTPPEIVEKLRAALKEVLQDKEFLAEAKKRNFMIDYNSPEEFENLCKNSMKLLPKAVEAIKWERKQFNK